MNLSNLVHFGSSLAQAAHRKTTVTTDRRCKPLQDKSESQT